MFQNWVRTRIMMKQIIFSCYKKNEFSAEADNSRYFKTTEIFEILTFLSATNYFSFKIYLESGHTFQTDVNSKK